MYKFSDKYRVDMVHFNSSVTAEQYAGPFSMRGYSRAAVVCLHTSGGTTEPIGSSASNDWSILVGNQATLSTGASNVGTAVASFSSLVGAKMHIGNSAATAFLGVDQLKLYYHTGTAAATNRITIDGVTFSIQANASVSDHQINSTDATGFFAQLGSALRTFATYLELARYATSATAAGAVLRLKDVGAGSQRKGFDFYVNANEAATLQLEVRQKRRQGIIEFTAADLGTTNATYTDFAIRLNATNSSLADGKVVCVIRECDYGATNTTVIVPTK